MMMKRPLFAAVTALLLAANGPAPAPEALLSPTDIELTAPEKAEIALGLKPDAWFAAQLRGPRERIDGQLLNPKTQFLAERSRERGADSEADLLAAFDTPEKRAKIRASVDREWRIHTAITADMASVSDAVVPGRGGPIAVRVYRPATTRDGPLPVLVYYHGGGFLFGSIAAMDRAVRLIANEADSIVVSVDYRLAPEHPFPAAQDDAEDAFLWARDHAAEWGGDAARVGVGGDSAGGHLALVTSLRQRAAGRPVPAYQLLYYPAVTLDQDDPSYRLFGTGYDLDIPFVKAAIRLAFPDPATHSAPGNWALAEKSLAGMPATIVATAGFDPLRDQGRELARRLERDGVSVTYLNYASLSHSFLNWSGLIDDARHAATVTAALFGDAIRSRDVAALQTSRGAPPAVRGRP